MTATLDAIEKPLDTPDKTTSESRLRRRTTPAGAEQMARPWRLGVLGIGIALGLISRLLAANGVTELMTNGMLYASALTSLLAGIGLIAQSAERDDFGRWMLLLTAMTGLSLAALQWISPNFATGTLEWSDTTQLSLAVLGLGNGVLFAGILTLALVRRWPTMTVVAVLTGAVLTLAANTVLLRREWPAIVALAAAFLFVLVGWDRAPRHEPVYRSQEGSPRISRAALSLATVALSGAGVQLWVSRGEDIGRALPAVGLSVVLLIVAFMAMIRIRRELQQRETTLSEWTSWMREFRTGDLRTDFESLGTTESGLSVGDLTAEPPRPLSFPDLRIDDENHPFRDLQEPAEVAAPPVPSPTIEIPTMDHVAASIEAPTPIRPEPVTQPALFGDQPPTAFEVLWADSEPLALDDEEASTSGPTVAPDQPSLFDFEQDLQAPTAPVASVPDAPAVTAPPVFEAPPDIPTPTAVEAPPAIEAPSTIPAPPEVPEISAPTPVVEAPQIAVPTPDVPTADVPTVIPEVPDAPAAAVAEALIIPLKAPSKTAVPEPPPAVAASSFSALTGPQPTLAPTPPAASAGGAFSSWLGAETTSLRTTTDELATWIAATPPTGTTRLIAAIETMSLADFDMLPAHVSRAMNDALQDMLEQVAPSPAQVTAIDGPYLMVAWDHIERSGLGAVNTMLRALLASPVETSEGAVALTGTLALLQPGADSTFDQVIDDAIVGLVHARQLEAAAKVR